MPDISDEILPLKNPFTCFPGTYLFFSRNPNKTKGFLKLVENEDIGIVSYNIGKGNLVLVISAKGLSGELSYAGMIHATSSTIKDVKKIIANLPDAYFLRAYLIGDKDLFNELKPILSAKKIKKEAEFPFDGVYRHVVLWYSPIDGLHMNISRDDKLPEELLYLLSKSKNITNTSKALLSITKGKLLPAFSEEELTKEMQKV